MGEDWTEDYLEPTDPPQSKKHVEPRDPIEQLKLQRDEARDAARDAVRESLGMATELTRLRVEVHTLREENRTLKASDGDHTAPICHINASHGRMKPRRGARGLFYGCRKYPNCKATTGTNTQ